MAFPQDKMRFLRVAARSLHDAAQVYDRTVTRTLRELVRASEDVILGFGSEQDFRNIPPQLAVRLRRGAMRSMKSIHATTAGAIGKTADALMTINGLVCIAALA